MDIPVSGVRNHWGMAIDAVVIAPSGRPIYLDRNIGGQHNPIVNPGFADGFSEAVDYARCSVPAPAGRFPVLFASQPAAILFHEALGHALEQSMWSSNRSFIEIPFTLQSLRIFDDPTRLDLFGGRSFDDTGREVGRTVLVERGKIVGLIAHGRDANVFGLTSNAGLWRSNFRFSAVPRMSNLVVDEDRLGFYDLIQEMGNGIAIRKASEGIYNRATGKFRIQALEANVVKAGKLDCSLEPFIIESDINSFRTNLCAIGKGAQSMSMYCQTYDGAVPVGHEIPPCIVDPILILPQ
jgi:TldD protein